MPLDQLLLFIAAGLLLNLTPGPDVLYVVTHALRSGARAGIVAALGITAGCFVHIVAAALGVSALMAASATAFMALKWAGALYLVYVGLRLLLSVKQSATFLGAEYVRSTGATTAHGPVNVFAKGFATNALNPKVALFFLAFLPQFIAPAVDNKPLAFFLLGLLFTFNGMWVNIGWAVAAAWVAHKARVIQSSMFWLDRIAGTLFIAFGLKLALTDNPVS
jgi:threonine/homoserine/homoserine lactone efflux protein